MEQNVFQRKLWVILELIRDISLIIFAGVFSWRLAEVGIRVLNVTEFRFTDMLSTILAVFAIGLSASFYFKANDVGNQFYDNMYKFIKDTSEMLGRIEAGFGERLRHLDESYIGLRERFDRLPFDKTEAKVEIAKEEEEELKKKETEREKLLEELVERSKLQEHEKTSMVSRLRKSEEDLQKAREELAKLRGRLAVEEEEEEEVSAGRHSSLFRIRAYTRFIMGKHIPDLIINSSSDDEIIKHFNKLRNKMPKSYLEDLRRSGIISNDGMLTKTGVSFIIDAISSSKHGKLLPTERLRCRWPVSQGAMRPYSVVVSPPLLDKHLRFRQRVEDLPVQQLVPQLAVERLDVSVLPWAPGFDE